MNGDVTQLLCAIDAGDPKAAEQLLPLVYEELRRLEARGDVSAAIAKYEEVMRGFPATDFAVDAEASIRSLRAKIG